MVGRTRRIRAVDVATFPRCPGCVKPVLAHLTWFLGIGYSTLSSPRRGHFKAHTSVANRITAYFRESREELRKVVWPSRKQTTNDTLLVVAISLFVAVFLGLLDLLMNYGIEKLVVK